MKLGGRRVWLIGASSGIGAAMVPELVSQGAQLAISARRGDDLTRLAERHGSASSPIIVEPLDVTVRGSIDAAAVRLRESRGEPDVLIYNAGAWSAMDVERFDVDAFEQQIAVNYAGMVRAIGSVLPAMVARRSGEIVGVASLSAYGGLPRAEAYGSTKAAVNYLLQSLRIDLARCGVGVTTVNPGFVRTSLTAHNDFPMPFIMEADAAARTIVEGLLAGRHEIHFPRRLSLPLKLVTAFPRPVYEWLVSRTVKS
jgi:short-subunit dehydrogenase